jgi:flagellar export protein FliJ
VKKFDFPLARVMEFRRLQARLEEIKLEALYAELRALDAREVASIQLKVQSEKEMKSAKSVTGFDLEVFDAYRKALQEDQKRMDKARADCRKRIDAQLAVLTIKRRDVKLLEHLKEQRFVKWEKEMFKEIDQQADEAYLAKFAKK